MILLLQAPFPAAAKGRKYKRAVQEVSGPLAIGLTVQGFPVSAQICRQFESVLAGAADRIPIYR